MTSLPPNRATTLKTAFRACDVAPLPGSDVKLLQESLDLTQRIGDIQNQAATLAMLGQLLADEKGEVETALNYLQQALEILQRLQSPEAETVSRILNRLKRDNLSCDK